MQTGTISTVITQVLRWCKNDPFCTVPKHNLITHHPQPNPGIAKPQGISALEPSEGCLLDPSPLFQPEFQPADTCQGRVQRARSGGLQGIGTVRVSRDYERYDIQII